MDDFDVALERVVAGMQSRRTLSDHERRVIAFHEAGHALCAELLPSVDRVHRISIIPRGKALGYTLNLPGEDRYLKTREELIDLMTMLLGGRVAEELVFGSITTGGADDLQRVAAIAHAMVHEYAMGTEHHLLERRSRRSSESTRRVSDEEVRELADGPPAPPARSSRTAASSLMSWPRRCWPTRSSSARTSTRIMRGIPRRYRERRAGGLLSVAAATPVEPPSHRDDARR